jgi:hypothetical protein
VLYKKLVLKNAARSISPQNRRLPFYNERLNAAVKGRMDTGLKICLLDSYVLYLHVAGIVLGLKRVQPAGKNYWGHV